HARHDDEFPFDAPDHPGAFRENLSPHRNCVAQAGQLHCSHLLRGLLSSRPPSWRGPQQTRPRTWRPRSFHEVESCEPPGSLLRSSLRRRHPASAEPAPSSPRNCRHRQARWDRFLLVDDVLYPIYEQFREDASFERVIVVPYGFNTVAEGFLNYEELLAASRDDFRYPAIDENDGAAMCFTSGTTGFSKGVIYSHRALVLHSFCCGLVEVLGLSEADTVLP